MKVKNKGGFNKPSGNIMFVYLGAGLIVLGILLWAAIKVGSWWIEGEIEDMLEDSNVPELVAIAESDDTVTLTLEYIKESTEKLSALDKENAILKEKLKELEKGKDVGSMFDRTIKKSN